MTDLQFGTLISTLVVIGLMSLSGLGLVLMLKRYFERLL